MTDNERALENIRLTIDDWDILKKAHAFFQPFDGLTRLGESDKSSLSQVFRAMDTLLKYYKSAKVKYSNPVDPDEKSDVNDKILRSIEIGWWVLDKYY